MTLGGLSIQILQPLKGKHYPVNTEIPIEFTITLDCGCPTCFKNPNFNVELLLFTPQGEKKSLDLTFNPKMATFNSKITSTQKGEYQIVIRAIQLESGRAGEKGTSFFVG